MGKHYDPSPEFPLTSDLWNAFPLCLGHLVWSLVTAASQPSLPTFLSTPYIPLDNPSPTPRILMFPLFPFLSCQGQSVLSILFWVYGLPLGCVGPTRSHKLRETDPSLTTNNCSQYLLLNSPCHAGIWTGLGLNVSYDCCHSSPEFTCAATVPFPGDTASL